MIRALLVALLVAIATPAAGQVDPSDVITTPDTATATWRARIVAESALVSAVGLAPCGSHPAELADLLEVVTLPAPSRQLILEGTVSFDIDAADLCFNAYAAGVAPAYRLSHHSPNALRVLLRPLPPLFVEPEPVLLDPPTP
jgi:hypothetical protein